MTNIANELRSFITDNYLYGQAHGNLSPDTSFIEQGIIDSTGVLELVEFLHRQYGIELDDEEIVPANLDSLRNLEVFVERKLAAKCVEATTCE